MALAHPAAVPLPAPVPATVRELLENELALEDERILTPLTDRLRRIAEALDRGEDVAPLDLSRGLELLDRYDREIHAIRVRRLLALLPKVPPPSSVPSAREGRLHLFRRKATYLAAPSEALSEEYDRIVEGERASESRVSALQTFADAYNSGGWGARERLASVLKGYLVADRVWARTEREYALHALVADLTPALDRQVRVAIALVTSARAGLQRDVERYVEEPLLPHLHAQASPLPMAT